MYRNAGYAGIYLRPSDIGCQYSRSIFTACFIMWQPRRATEHWRIGDRAFSVAALRAWNRLPTELKLLRSTDLFRRDLKTFCFILSTGSKIQIDSVMHPQSSSGGRNTSASVTVTVTFPVWPNLHNWGFGCAGLGQWFALKRAVTTSSHYYWGREPWQVTGFFLHWYMQKWMQYCRQCQ